MSYSFCLLFVCGARLEVGSALWLTVAVFLTKNPNLTLSKFWPAAPAEMRNSPLPTNGSFRLEIYGKKTLQHSPGEDVYSLCLQRIPKTRKENQDWENILCTFLDQTIYWVLFLWNEDRALGLTLSLKSAQKLPSNAWILSLTEQWDRVIGQRKSSALRSCFGFNFHRETF